MATKLQVTIFLKETDMIGDLPLYEVIVRRLLHRDIAGATVLRGIMGYGRQRHIHHQGLLGISDDHPIMVVAIDDRAKLEPLLPGVRSLAPTRLILTQEVSIWPV